MVVDPLSKQDPWRSFVGTPQATHRGAGAHSGMTPQLQKAHESLEAFLSGTGTPTLEPVPSPVAGAGPDAMLQAVVSGVNELRANAVTRQTLTKLYEFQSEEMRVYVQAETTPMHHGIDRIAKRKNARCTIASAV